MTDSDVQWLARRIDALEAKMDSYIRDHTESHEKITQNVNDINVAVATISSGISAVKWAVGIGLTVSGLLVPFVIFLIARGSGA